MYNEFMKRLYHTIRLYMIPGSRARAEYLRSHQVFHSMGRGCTIMERKVPLYSELISIGNNVHLASKVFLVPHDAIHLMLNGRSPGGYCFKEKIGCIEVGDNVFIGAGSTVLYDVKIGSNVVVGAGSVVNKDIPDGCVVAGVPAKVIGKFEDLAKKRKEMVTCPESMKMEKNRITPQLETWYWDNFYHKRT